MTVNRIDPYTLAQQTDTAIEPELLPEDRKYQLAEAGIPFDVIRVEDATHPDYGDFYIMTVQLPGGLAKIAMSNPDANPKLREKRPELIRQWHALQQITQEGQAVGPYLLKYVSPRDGYPFYKLAPANPPTMLLEPEQQALPVDTEKSTSKRGNKT